MRLSKDEEKSSSASLPLGLLETRVSLGEDYFRTQLKLNVPLQHQCVCQVSRGWALEVKGKEDKRMNVLIVIRELKYS